MNSTEPVRRIHLIGICGTAMASLAGMLQATGYEVAGSDQNIYPPMSTFLEKLGIRLFEGFSDNHLSQRLDLVVVGNAISRGNPEVEHMLNARIRYASMAGVLKEFFIRDKRSLVVTGTHGKTTTTSLLSWLLETAGLDPSFFVGGIAENFGSSFKLGKGSLFVIEGDEYDTAFFDKGPKFLHYLPEQVVFNNCEFDHADIYTDLESVKTSFRRLINIIPSKGRLVACWDDPVVRELSSKAFCPVESFGLESESRWSARSIEFLEATTRFEAVCDGVLFGTFETPLAGSFNVKNCLGAIACASGLGIDASTIGHGMRSFKNVKRRLEARGKARGVTVFDDFAHHPTAIHETLSAVRARYPDSRLWAIFEPRSATSRRNVFQKEFSGCFGKADRVVLCGLFAPEKLDASIRLNVAKIVQDLRSQGTRADQWDSAAEIVRHVTPELEPGDKVVVMSNGGFDGIHQKLLDALK